MTARAPDMIDRPRKYAHIDRHLLAHPEVCHAIVAYVLGEPERVVRSRKLRLLLLKPQSYRPKGAQ